MLQKFSTERPMSGFAPRWKEVAWYFVYEDEDAIDEMREWLLDNSQRIMDNTSPDDVVGDGGTGLGANSITAQYKNFNVWYETRNVPVFNKYKKRLYEEYKKFVISIGQKEEICDINGWYNMVDKGGNMTPHHHGRTPMSYLSSNMHLDNYDTKTVYFSPVSDDSWEYSAVKGGTIIFPSYMYHAVTTFEGDDIRVSMACDFYIKRLWGETSAYNSVILNDNP